MLDLWHDLFTFWSGQDVVLTNPKIQTIADPDSLEQNRWIHSTPCYSWSIRSSFGVERFFENLRFIEGFLKVISGYKRRLSAGDFKIRGGFLQVISVSEAAFWRRYQGQRRLSEGAIRVRGSFLKVLSGFRGGFLKVLSGHLGDFRVKIGHIIEASKYPCVDFTTSM